jgi:hypothetical protein
MGRPRKRQCNGEPKESNPHLNSIVPEFDTLLYFDDSFEFDPFANVGGLQYPNDVMNYPAIPSEPVPATGLFTVDDARGVFHFGDEFNTPIDFGADGASNEEAIRPIETTVPEHLQGKGAFASGHPAPNAPGPPCSCLPTMYLAMSSLQEFPTEVENALATVRAAAIAAQATIRCTQCGHWAATSVTPPIEAFQNTMLLGTIFPIIVNGYKRLLVMVDEETEKAKAAGIKNTFRMSAYGGLCGRETACMNAKHLDEAEMDPTDWRTAVRGLLRVDVYGMEGVTTGLRGIISEMEQRQRLRHKEMHQQLGNGSAHDVEQRQCLGEKDMLCLRILDTAKISLDTLVIA